MCSDIHDPFKCEKSHYKPTLPKTGKMNNMDKKQAVWDCMWLTAVFTQNNVVKYTQIQMTK